jgi:serine/threonine-protein kinase
MSHDLHVQLEASLGGTYTIERELGGGGMSRVFVATDRALNRRVVIKVLSPELAAEVSTKRFAREIRLAASLQQANIVPVLAAGGTGDVPYYVMPFVDGLSLRDRLARGSSLSAPECIGILRDVARALVYAHERGVMHRDIKPENVLLSGDSAVVTDFGIAKAIASARQPAAGGKPGLESTVTLAGTAVGTPAYMAPEQISGDPGIDHRADLYSFGCLAYELFSGRTPFESQTLQGLFAAHLAEAPVPLHELNPDVPPAVEAISMRCLAKEPSQRPQAAREILQALDVPTTRASRLVRLGRRLSRRQRRVIAITAAVAAVGVLAAVIARNSRPSVVAVVPFLNVGGDTAEEYLADGMADGLATALGKVDGIRIVSRSLGYRYKGRRSLDARDVRRDLSVDHVLHGSVRRIGSVLRVSAHLTNAHDNAEVWSASYDRSAADMSSVQDEIIRRIATTLGAQLGRDGAAPSVGSANPDAYDLYLRGRFLLQRRGAGVRQSIDKFEQAIAHDSAFALAHASLALALQLWPYFEDVNARNLEARATRAIQRALASDSTIAEAHTAQAMMHQHRYEWAAAEQSYRRALTFNANEADSHIQFGRFLFYTGQVARSEPLFRRARALDPSSSVASSWLGHILFIRGRRDDGMAEMRRAVEIDSTNPPSLVFFAQALRDVGRNDEARAVVDRLWRNYPNWRRVVGTALFQVSDSARSAATARELTALSADHPLKNFWLAMRAAAIRDSTSMFEALERATAAGEIWPTYQSAGGALFDFARGSARWAAIVRSAGLDVGTFTAPDGGRSR